ncbi:hypothetical protein J7J23_00350 [bacterium]|nr:hypothetical protein [bacterium]
MAINFKNFDKVFPKFFGFIFKNLLILAILLFLLDAGLFGFFVWKYYFKAIKAKPKLSYKYLTVNEKLVKDFDLLIEKRLEKFNNVYQNSYKDVFKER